MGGLDDRRGAALAELAPHLWRLRADLRLFGVDRPVDAATPQAVFGADKYRLLSSAKLLLNIHRDRPTACDSRRTSSGRAWSRRWPTAASSSPSRRRAAHPLVPGTHFVEAGDRRDGRRPSSAARRRSSAGSASPNKLAERSSASWRWSTRSDRCSTASSATCSPTSRRTSNSSAARRVSWRLGLSRGPHPVRLGAVPAVPADAASPPSASPWPRTTALQRLDAAACQLRHGSRQHIVRTETPAFAGANPEVSVVVTLYNYADVVAETLDSIAASEGVSFEVIVVEDHATDDSRAVVQRFIDEHPDVPMVLLAKDANEGLAAARNTGFEHARAPLVMVMDADNTIYPTLPAQARRRAARRPRRRCRVRDPRGLRRPARHAQRARVGRRSSVRGQLHRRPGDAAQVGVAAPRRLPRRRRARLRLGGLGPVAAAGGRRRAGDARDRRSSVATGCSAAR